MMMLPPLPPPSLRKLREGGQDSDYFYIVIHNNTSEKVIEEFNVAYKSFEERLNPKITTYVKLIEGEKPNAQVEAFVKRLMEELHHYYSNYTSIDTVKLDIVLKIQSLGLYKAENMEVEGSTLRIDNQEMLTIDNIPIFLNNKNLDTLNHEYTDIEREYWELRKQYSENLKDDGIWNKYYKISTKRQEMKEAIHNLQMRILNTEASFVEKQENKKLTMRQIYGRECLERGDLEGALGAMDFDAMVAEVEQDDLIQEGLKHKAKTQIADFLFRVELLEMDINNPQRFEKIEETFKYAVEMERKLDLDEQTATYKYIWHLSKQYDFEKAIIYSEKYLKWLNYREMPTEQIADAHNLLAVCYFNLNNLDKAEEQLQKANSLIESLVKEQNNSFEIYLPDICINLAALYGYTMRYAEAEELYKKVLEIRERLTQENPAVFEYDIEDDIVRFGDFLYGRASSQYANSHP
jgi:hypothetical protein